MDVDFMKLSPAEDDRTETMLLQMGKIPEFAAFYEDNVDTLMSEPNHVYDDVNAEWNSYYDIVTEHPHVNSSAFTNLRPPSAVSFSHQEPPALPLLQQQPNPGSSRWETGEYSGQVQKRNSVAAMREMIFQIAAMQPVHVDLESVKPPKRKNVKISTDPQSVAARHRRERISERIRILQRLVPGGTKMDTASMLDEAIHYMKFLKNQVQSLKRVVANGPPAAGMGFPVPMSGGNFHFAVDGKGYH